MSRSRNTKPNKYKIESQEPTPEKPHFPRIIERKPRIGDVHPVPKKDLIEYFQSMPVEYLYKLDRIELLPRLNNKDNTLAYHSSKERKIVIYSYPLKREDDLMWSIIFHFWKESGKTTPSNYYIENDIFYIEWEPEELKQFFLEEIIPHELGHHASEINKNRKPKPRGKYVEEIAEKYKVQINEKYNEVIKDLTRK